MMLEVNTKWSVETSDKEWDEKGREGRKNNYRERGREKDRQRESFSVFFFPVFNCNNFTDENNDIL